MAFNYKNLNDNIVLLLLKNCRYRVNLLYLILVKNPLSVSVSGIKNKMGIFHFYSNSSYPKELTLNSTKSEKSSLAQTKNLILSNVSPVRGGFHKGTKKNLLF